jgi:hypothetical protein
MTGLSAARDLAATAARVREIAAATPPAGLDTAALAAWYAAQLGALSWHAVTLADEITRRSAS